MRANEGGEKGKKNFLTGGRNGWSYTLSEGLRSKGNTRKDG